MKNFIIVLFSIFLSLTTIAQKVTGVFCELWKPTSFCDKIPNSLFPDSAYGTDCSWKEKTCEEMNEKKELIGVILTFKNETNNSFEYKTNFENIKIKDKNNKYINPTAIFYSPRFIKDGKTISNIKYITNLKANKYVNYLNAGSKTDIIMLFQNAEKGDKLIIDNFIEAEIQ